METSELYKMNDQYYLTVLVDVEGSSSLYQQLLARMREFADDSDISVPVLQEYGQVIINHDVVQGLQKVWKYLKKDREIEFSVFLNLV